MRSIHWTWLILLVAVASLAMWDRGLAEREQEGRDMTDRIGRFIRADRRAFATSMVTLELGGQPALLYTLDDGVWRLANLYGAICLRDQVEGLVKSILEAEGVVRTTDRGRAAEFHLDDARRLRVTLHGPDAFQQEDRDVRLVVELGRPGTEVEGCYARREQNGPIWQIDTNPLGFLASPPGIPPLVDPYVIPRIWPGESRRIDRITVERAGERYDLVLKERQVTDEDLRRGVSPVYWNLSFDGQESPTAEGLAMAYNGFLFRAPYVRHLDPSSVAGGLGDVLAKVILRPADKPAGEILIAGSELPEMVRIYFPPTEALYLAPAKVLDVFAPEAAALAEGATANRWEPYLSDGR